MRTSTFNAIKFKFILNIARPHSITLVKRKTWRAPKMRSGLKLSQNPLSERYAYAYFEISPYLDKYGGNFTLN